VITIGTVKSLAFKYGIDILIRAFARLRGIVDDPLAQKLRLLIVGGGPQEDELKRLAREVGVGGVTTFVGPVLHMLVPEYLNRLDIYVALSRLESESFGVSVLEASACGLPVVVSDVGGLPEVVLHGKTGYVVKREDPDSAAAALARLVHDERLRHSLGRAGRSHVRSHYEWGGCVERLLEVYTAVLRGVGT
jgi:glycosyltransferase involved in cell wall biosynthesis